MRSETDPRVVLKAENILKVYPNGVVANKDVNLEVYEGEIHALIGENGAGKSTLMKILFGMESAEEGKLYVNGSEVKLDSPKKAITLGIGMVHQHFMLVDSLSIAENIFLGQEPKKYGIFMDRKEMEKLSADCAKKYNFQIDVRARVADVSVGIKQETEILKALVRGAKILILDEPTAVLTPQETKLLFQELRTLKQQGHTIIFISHKLNEIMEICDRVTIMRHGTTIETTDVKDTSPQDISNKMVGREIVLHIDKAPAHFGGLRLRTEGISYINRMGKTVLDRVSIQLRAGEILSVAGVEGNGQGELAEILAGLKSPSAGKVFIDEKDVQDFRPAKMREFGISYIPQDRMSVGCAVDMSIRENIFANTMNEHLKKGFVLDKKGMIQESQERVEQFRILCTNAEQSVGMLSGGNIQKVVAAREVTDDAKVVIAEQPTRGIDAGASELIRSRLVALRDTGAAILLISADLNEVLELSDSCIVMYNGRVNAYFEDTTRLTEEELGYYMLGVKRQNQEGGR